jgi:hypothetical protein
LNRWGYLGLLILKQKTSPITPFRYIVGEDGLTFNSLNLIGFTLESDLGVNITSVIKWSGSASLNIRGVDLGYTILSGRKEQSMFLPLKLPLDMRTDIEIEWDSNPGSSTYDIGIILEVL